MKLLLAWIVLALAGVGLSGQTPLPAWVRPDSATRTVTLGLVATRAAGAAVATLNGVFRGDLQVVVPLGWTVKLEWRNDDSTAHSFSVQQEREKLPERAGEPAFQYAYSRTPVAGMGPGRTDHTQFVVDQAGWYWILCGVPGHAIEGEYISLKVDRDVTKVAVGAK